MSSTIAGVIAGGYTVSLNRLGGADIDPAKETWIIMHGRGQSPTNMQYLAATVQAQRPNAQVLMLDWKTAAVGTLAETEDRTPAVGAWVAQALTNAGFAAGAVNMIGFSYGCYTASEAARALPGGANVIVAIDPGVDAAPSAFDPLTVNYAALSQFSISFYAGPPYGNAPVAGTADEAVFVRNSSHIGAYDVAHRLIELNPDFALSRFLAHQSAGWLPDQFNINGVLGSGPFDAAVNTTNGGFTPTTIDFVPVTSGAVTFTSGADDVTLTNPGVNVDALAGNDHVRGTASADSINGNTGDDTLEGLGGNDTLLGGAGVDILDGGAGADRMEGGDGADTYVVDDAGDLVVESSTTGGTDLVQANVSYTLGDNVENLTLYGSAANATGNSLANTLVGNDVANILDGKAGADSMSGGAGDDTYVVDDAGDLVIETSATGGIDLVQAYVSYTLGDNVENLTLYGSAANATGNALANTLIGNSAANILDGKAGADSMYGGDGADTYIVDDAGDLAIESSTTGGVDLVQAYASYTLGDNVENLTLYGSAANATGNALANTLVGNDVANILDGKAGADTMSGGAGDDTYVVDNAGDRVTENTGAGTDLVQSAISFTLGSNTENLTLLGGAAINGTGNGLANTIVGNELVNRLSGDAGADVLNGGGGHDTLIGGLDADKFVFTSANFAADADLISDFSHAQGDVIQLENGVFTALQAAPGTIDANAFYLGARAHDADDRIMYDATDGSLYYDADGTGRIDRVMIASLTGHPALVASDIVII